MTARTYAAIVVSLLVFRSPGHCGDDLLETLGYSVTGRTTSTLSASVRA